MKKALVVFGLLLSLKGLTFDFPEKFLGEYNAEIESYKFEYSDNYHRASSHSIRIILQEDMVWYQSGKVTLEGSYKNVKKAGDNYTFDINVNNNRSIDFDFNIDINKKTGIIILSGLNGVPSTRMIKKLDKPTKNKGFGRL
ncbi:MAG: hypothetical protein R2780_04130 [Crocinitomicaceae bacterium]|nr:hypothetical protein [Crocinitomicaceae bacterium]